jgi:phytoene synthase
MADESTSTPLASFEAKWVAAHPEFGLALKFVPHHARGAQSAFACLVYELEHTAFGIREAQPAAIKLQWWAEEFARAGRREARHPLTQALVGCPGFTEIPLARWYEVVGGALAQRDREPAADGATLFDNYAEFYWPLAAIEASLFGADVTAAAGALVITRALRELVALPHALQSGSLPLPLDLLARHRLARGDLSQASIARTDAVRDWLFRLAAELTGTDLGVELKWAQGRPEATRSVPRLSVFRSAMSAVEANRALRAARARDPLTALAEAVNRLSLSDLWSAWRAGRRSRA